MTLTTFPIRPRRRSLLQALASATALVAGALFWQGSVVSLAFAEDAITLPAPAKDEPAGDAHSETAIFAGGCFWGVQGVFQHVRGVQRAVSGYSGGKAETADYEMVSNGDTGHAESVQVTFDPRQVSYGTLLQIFFSVAHDPTQLNRQGPDHGTQYRSALFPTSTAQQQVAEAYIAQLDAARVFPDRIVTRIEQNTGFYPAEDYHQDFLVENPAYPYIVIYDLPKIGQLKRLFPTQFRNDPVLVKSSS